MKIVTIVGARPQFVKAAMVSQAIHLLNDSGHEPVMHEIIVHTGQHYNDTMSQVFFQELGIPDFKYNLEVGSGSHAFQTGQMLMKLDRVFLDENPDLALVYGDTNSTIAAALAASKLQIPIGHVEAGLRSYNRSMPEEINRILADRISTLLFCPTRSSATILRQEGIEQGVFVTGDVMLDATLHYTALAKERSTILSQYRLVPQQYYLATVHRPANADKKENMMSILRAFGQLPLPVMFPVHPRTKQMISTIISQQALKYDPSRLILIEPVGYLDMLMLEQHAQTIITDSGGVQKEAYFLRVPCVTLRAETEWVETVQSGWNRLCRIAQEEIIEIISNASRGKTWEPSFGNGTASLRIVEILRHCL